MPLYSVEIFSRSFEYKLHDLVSDINYEFDYLAPAENDVIITTSEAAGVGDLICISSEDHTFFGMISSVDRTDERQMSISYKPFESLFETKVVFDTTQQSDPEGISLEQMLKNHILANFVNNSDSVQNVLAIRNVTLSSSTMNWGFNLKSDKEGMNRCVINLYDTLMVRSLQEYGVAVRAVPDLSARKVDIVIGTISANTKTIEADLPNILSKQIIIRKTSASTNKLTVINSADFTTTRIFYLHPDGSYDRTDSNRVTPVINEIKVVDVQTGSTFAKTAASQAAEVFGKASYNNLIELEVMNDDTLVDPNGIQIGQLVNVIHDGISYASILSGKQIRSTTKLIFGCIRLNLTKIIKMGGYTNA